MLSLNAGYADRSPLCRSRQPTCASTDDAGGRGVPSVPDPDLLLSRDEAATIFSPSHR